MPRKPTGKSGMNEHVEPSEPIARIFVIIDVACTINSTRASSVDNGMHVANQEIQTN
jgi:hypothetical protein